MADVINFSAWLDTKRADAARDAAARADAERLASQTATIVKRVETAYGHEIGATARAMIADAVTKNAEAQKPSYLPAYCDPSNERRGAKHDATRSLDVAEIAKRMRADIKALALGDGFKVAVTIKRYSGGQSIDIRVRDVPPGFRYYAEKAASWCKQFPGKEHRMPMQWRDALERSSGFYPSDEATKMDRLVIAITPDDVDTAPATPERDRATRVKLVRTYLALRQARARSAEQAAQLAIGQAQYDALKGQLVSTEAALATAQTRLEQGRADARRFADVEQSLIDARTRGNRLLRVAMGQRTGLARVRLDLRGARAESGALRRQLAQAVAPTSPKSPPHGVMADALARAGF